MTSDLSATASVIAHTSQLGMEKLIGDSVGYLNIDAAVLTSEILEQMQRRDSVARYA